MKLVSSDEQLARMKARLGSRAKKWSDKGIDFLAIRSRARGGDGTLAERVIDLYVRGEVDNLSAETNHEAAKAFNRGVLDPESLVILLLGREPKKTPNGIQELSAVLSPAQVAAQRLVADALTGGERYINKKRGR